MPSLGHLYIYHEQEYKTTLDKKGYDYIQWFNSWDGFHLVGEGEERRKI